MGLVPRPCHFGPLLVSEYGLMKMLLVPPKVRRFREEDGRT
jgi:hypothetical protein